MPLAARPFHRSMCRRADLVTLAALALLSSACSNKSTPKDLAQIDVCVLTGATVSAGCVQATDGSPLVDFKDVGTPESKSLVVAIYDNGGGDVGATVADVHLEPSSDTNFAAYTLTLFTLDANGNEVPGQLPMTVAPGDKSELRARVTFATTNFPDMSGAVSGVSISIRASHPQTTVTVPIVANLTGCAPGFGDCDGNPANGCETPLNTTTNCGKCASNGGTCVPTNATDSVCANGGGVMACQFTCLPGYADCNGQGSDGCEANLASPGSCGSCSNTCPVPAHASAVCKDPSKGLCSYTCNPGWGDCDGNPANGCETDLTTTTNCGTCGNTCSKNNGTPSCNAGKCAIACNAGWANCDNNVANGCEASLTSVSNCGSCGHTCPAVPNATQYCSDYLTGTCAIYQCAYGFFDQNGAYADGCECQQESPTQPHSCPGKTESVGQNVTVTESGSIVPVSQEDWFAVSFARPGAGTHFTWTITLTDNSGLGVIAMDVFSDCYSTGAICNGSGESPTGITSWVYDSTYGSRPTDGDVSPTTVDVRVHSTTSGAVSSCLPYQISFTSSY
jgi:hypothetical protein